MNRILVSIVLALLVTGCALPESEQLRKENTDLKAQLETLTQERDALKLQIDSIRKALEAPGTVQDPVTGLDCSSHTRFRHGSTRGESSESRLERFWFDPSIA
jgi:hypothetical protein